MIIISASIFTAIVASFPIFSLSSAFGLSPIYEETFLGEFKYKMDRLETREGKKIVLVGGSALPFGIRSPLLEQEFEDYEVVNLGMYASLGSEAMLYFARANIQQGDIYIISPEQHEQTLSMYFSASTMWQALDGAYGLFNHLSMDDKEEMILALPQFSIDKASHQNDPYEGEGIYKKSSFDEYGDISSDLPKYNRMVGGYDANNLISFSSEVIEDEFIDEMNSFYKEASKKGAEVYYHFAPSNELAVEDSSLVDSYYDYLSEKLDFPILGNPHGSIIDGGYFYDTNFHLNNSGAIFNTVRLIDDLKTAKGDDSATDISIPEAPEIPEKEIIQGDDTYQEYFEYEEIEGGYKITKLKDSFEGDSIIVPSTYQDKQVLCFDAEVFQDSGLKEAAVQENILTLLDSSFANSSIEGIYIENISPSSISVGSGLLDDCFATIYVPSIAINSYMSDYNWSQYGMRIQSK